jgi:hypothetical protein
MKKTLLLVMLLTFPALAQSPSAIREAFPSDYTPSPCAADTAAVCKSFAMEKMSSYGATFRGFDMRQEWVNEHWDEMTKAFTPLCTKIANCFTVKVNDWVYCLDIMREDFIGTCNRFPADSEDRRQCTMFAMTYYIGLGAKTQLHKASQDCIAANPTTGERKLEAWIQPQTFAFDFHDLMTVFAYDAETHIPVRALVTIDAGTLRSTEGPVSTAGYATKWRAGLKNVTNAQGHRDLVGPTMTLTATGYQPLTIPMPVEVPKAIVEMTPPAAELKPGTNNITVTARDAATGKPAELRVMAGDRVVGKTNTPLQLELMPGKKRPEIWVTSLYHRYSDVVVAQAQ